MASTVMAAATVRAVKGRRIIPTRAALTLTPNAVKKIKEILQNKSEYIGLKVGVRQRGCNGLSYTLDYVKEKSHFDEEVVQDGVHIIIDKKAQLSLLVQFLNLKQKHCRIMISIVKCTLRAAAFATRVYVHSIGGYISSTESSMEGSWKMLLLMAMLIVCANGLPYRESEVPYQAEDLPWYANQQPDQLSAYPDPLDNIDITQTIQAPALWDVLNPSDSGSNLGPVQQSQEQETLGSGSIYQQTSQKFPAEDEFTVSCTGQNRVCVNKNLCVNGYVHPLKQGFVRTAGQAQECRVKHEVCCTVDYNLNQSGTNAGVKDNEIFHGADQQREVSFDQHFQKPDTETKLSGNHDIAANDIYQEQVRPVPTTRAPTPRPTHSTTRGHTDQGFDAGHGSGSSPVQEQVLPLESSVFSIPLQLGCAAALLCVEEQFCTLQGVISTEPVSFTSKQLLRRVPLSTCKNPDTGVVGKCCRDPNYVDPWPTTNLPANYTGGFDDLGFPTFLNIAKVRPPQKPSRPTKTNPPTKNVSHRPRPTNVVYQPTTPLPKEIVPDNSDISSQFVTVPKQVTHRPTTEAVPYYPDSSDQRSVSLVPQVRTNQCGVKNTVPRPHGLDEVNTAFGEIPWQAMVLHAEHRQILCSGVLVAPDRVLTAANCVYGLSPSDVSVKLGEWKLGFEVKEEEPLPFEIVRVKSIEIHPNYVQGSSSNDMAVLLLKHPAAFTTHINPLCLPRGFEYQENRRCMVTGWGKVILQGHYAGSIMNMIDVDLLAPDNCRERISSAEGDINYADNLICVKAQKQRNNMCQTDVGGPLACDNGNGVFELAGIYSQDTGCLPTNQVAVFAPVDTAWLEQGGQSTTAIKTLIPTPRTVTKTSVPYLPPDSQVYRESNYSSANQYLPPV
ncbi:hypothetical protein KM043_011805 [Ampulex compressa]|nr:hypothetical protein KM043_011805 [Ampulex compressa]